MFLPAKINHAKLYLKQSKTKKLVAELHKHGVCQIFESKQMDGSLEYKRVIVHLHNNILHLKNQLSEYKPLLASENAFKAMFKPAKPRLIRVGKQTDEALIREIRNYVKKIQPVVDEKIYSITQLESKIEENKQFINSLKIFPCNINLNLYQDSKILNFFLGTIIKKELATLTSELNDKAVFLTELKNEKNPFVAVVVHNENTNLVSKALYDGGFQSLNVPLINKMPKQLIAKYQEENTELNKQIAHLRNELKVLFLSEEKKIGVMNENIEACIGRIDALQKISAAEKFVVLDAWVPEKDTEKFNRVVKEKCKDFYLEMFEDEKAPTKYDHGRFTSSFELITNLYSPPKYDHFDPTFFIAFTFPLFFGIMLTDFVYGTVLTLFAMGLYFGAGKYDLQLRKFSYLLIISGAVTAIMGAFFGSYFGNFFDALGFQIPRVLDSMRDILPMIIMVLVIGLIHLGMGIVAGFVENTRKGKLKNAFGDQGVWLLFIVSLILFVIPIPIMKTVGFVVLGISVVMQVVFNVMDGGPIIGILSIFGFSSFIGDWFSYVRLMALAIGTSGIALAVNFMVFLVYDMVPYVGIIFAALVFIAGHLFNLAMNGLGAFIHTLRLHFLEHFQKYFEGGGYIYRPFKANRKITYEEV